MGGISMHQQMQAMRAQMSRIHATEDPYECRKLMQEHRQSMHDMMKMMHEVMAGQSLMARQGMIGDCPMMGPGMMRSGQASMMIGGQHGMMSYRQAMMAERMDMMQMTEHQEAVAETRKMMRGTVGKGP